MQDGRQNRDNGTRAELLSRLAERSNPSRTRIRRGSPSASVTVAGVRVPPFVAAMRETPPWALAGRSGHSDR